LALESASYISQLIPSNPPEGDPAVQAADHLRLIKSVLQASFPNVNGAATGTPKQLSSDFVPVGGIISWYGSLASIPAGWGLCNGSTYSKVDGSGTITTPNLEDVFLLGAGGASAPGATGGSSSTSISGSTGGTSLTQANLPSYNLTVTDTGHTHGITDPGHNHTIVASSADGSGYANSYGLSSFVSPTSPTSTDTTGITLASATTGITVASGGSGTAHSHGISGSVPTIPPFMALAYIMKL